MKTIIRNFINVLIRFKVATFLNVAGLAVAFAAFLIIMMQVSFEHNFDRCHPNSTRIYRMGLSFPDGASMIVSLKPCFPSFLVTVTYISPIYGLINVPASICGEEWINDSINGRQWIMLAPSGKESPIR